MPIFDIFKSAFATPAAAPNNTPPATEPTNNSPAPAPATTPTEPAAPLDEFSKLWENDPNSPTDQNPSVFGEIDPKKIHEAARTNNFLSAVPKELMEKVAAGGEDATQAMLAAMNLVSQTAYAQSTVAATKLIDAALAKQAEQFEARLPGIIKQHSAADSLLADNPALSNPAIAPIISVLQAQLATKFPNATASELKQKAQEYFVGAANLLNPEALKKNQQTTTKQSGEMDWSVFLQGPQ